MKKAGAFVASVAAASSVALQPASGPSLSASPDVCRVVPLSCCSRHEASASSSSSPARTADGSAGSHHGAPEDKFAPRFDGLRFIETLVTAHR